MTENNYLQDLGTVVLGTETSVVHDGKVLMHKRSKNKKRFPGWWVGPGGHIDENEDALTAAIREVKEETGVKIKTDDIKLKAVSFHYHLDHKELYILYYFRATIPSKQKVTKETNEGLAQWIAINKLLKMKNVFPPAKYYFNHILKDEPGILYTNIQWKNSQLVKVLSQQIEKF
jgi:8-oxo-dGTP diphosphatase